MSRWNRILEESGELEEKLDIFRPLVRKVKHVEIGREDIRIDSRFADPDAMMPVILPQIQRLIKQVFLRLGAVEQAIFIENFSSYGLLGHYIDPEPIKDKLKKYWLKANRGNNEKFDRCMEFKEHLDWRIYKRIDEWKLKEEGL